MSTGPTPRRDDATIAAEARRALSIDRWTVVGGLYAGLGVVGLFAIRDTARGHIVAAVILVALVAVAAFIGRFVRATPSRWVEATRTNPADAIVYAEVLAADLRRQGLPSRTSLRSDGRLHLSAAGLAWTARYGGNHLTVDAADIGHVLIGPAPWRRWFVVTDGPGRSSRFYVSEPDAVEGALRDHGIEVRRTAGG